ncbi:uncharacterized protein LOC126175701 [Schistocerca cancellata]|uniref:uncharacterized protein LOC126175701 n=1 Tax=Schistocerca cancellata TaxID=274614 RepID=UPI002118E24E|nr:uncharacterized protein LOC126175701 [Schistocerca cancellata]
MSVAADVKNSLVEGKELSCEDRTMAMEPVFETLCPDNKRTPDPVIGLRAICINEGHVDELRTKFQTTGVVDRTGGNLFWERAEVKVNADLSLEPRWRVALAHSKGCRE